MAQAVPDGPEEFWRPPVLVHAQCSLPAAPVTLAETCRCGSEFMIAARYCHACGMRRPRLDYPRARPAASHSRIHSPWTLLVEAATTALLRSAEAWARLSFPQWCKPLRLSVMKRRLGLPTPALIAFFVGLGCVAAALAVGLLHDATNLAVFQAIQMWRVEWLLAATASFVAGILLNQPSPPKSRKTHPRQP